MQKITCFAALLALLGSALAVPVDLPISFTTTAAPLANAHNQTVLESVCVDMLPMHGSHPPQAVLSPYHIRVSHENAVSGQTIQVTISSEGVESFRGVYIQARHGDTPVGKFVLPEGDSPTIKLTNCPPGTDNAASYISRTPISELTLRYIVPDVPSFQFRATFVKSFSVFWVNVSSSTVRVSNASNS